MTRLCALLVTALLVTGCWTSETQYIAPDETQGLDALVGDWLKVTDDPYEKGGGEDRMAVVQVRRALMRATVFPAPAQDQGARAEEREDGRGDGRDRDEAARDGAGERMAEEEGPEILYFYAMNAPGTSVYVILSADELGADGPPSPAPNTPPLIYDMTFLRLDGDKMFILEEEDEVLKKRLVAAGANVATGEWGVHHLRGDAAAIRAVLAAFMKDPASFRRPEPGEFFQRAGGD